MREGSEVRMITVPLSASSPYRSYSDGSKVFKEPLVRSSEDHPSPNEQVCVLCLSIDIIAKLVRNCRFFFLEICVEITFDIITFDTQYF